MTCIIHPGYKQRGGYATCTFEGKTVLAHRAQYCIESGLSYSEIKGLVIRHTCDNPPCVNPEHLLIGTQADNVKDCINRGRRASRKGLNNGRAKITYEITQAIRKEYSITKISQIALGKRYGVSNQLISLIVNNHIWRSP